MLLYLTYLLNSRIIQFIQRRKQVKISKIQLTIPVTYKITDYNEEEIQGSCYEQELQKTSQSTFRIEKVLKRQGDKSLVKWM